MNDDVDVMKARALARALVDIGVHARFVHEPNGIPGVAVELAQHNDYFNPDTDPVLFVFIEDSDSYKLRHHHSKLQIGWIWHGQLGNMYAFDDGDGDWLETGFEWIERTWLGDTEHAVARNVKTLLQLFKEPADLAIAE